MKLEILASLCKEPFFYFLVESVNLFPSISASILSCCVSFIHMMIYSIMFIMFLVLHFALILMFTTLKAIFENQLFVNSSKLSTILRPRAKFAITNYDSLYVSLLCFLYLLQVELYISELSSIMTYVLMNVMLLFRILLSTLHSINLRSCLWSSVSLGDKRSLSLGGVDTSILHHYSMS